MTNSNGNGILPSPQAVSSLSTQEQTFAQSPSLGSTGMDVDWFLMRPAQEGAFPLEGWWSRLRDYQLRQYVRRSIVLSAIVAGRSSQIKNMGWTLNAEDKAMESLLPIYHDMITTCQRGDGFRSFLDMWCTDFHTQDNGAFIELIGEGEEFERVDRFGNRVLAKGYLPKNKVVGFAHMDAAQVWRTYNQDYPYIYINAWTGRRYIMHWSRMFGRSSFRQPYERGRGVGFCATSRAFGALEIVQASNDFIYEKMIGASPEIAISSGVAMKAISDALKTGAVEMDNKGLIRYKGTVFVKGDAVAGIEPDIKIVGLRNVPDGWDREKELQLSILLIAMAFTTDPRDLGWNVGLQGQTKADAEVQDLKTSGRGRADVMNEIEDFFNLRILPSGIKFAFDNKDDLEDQRRALIAQTRIDSRAVQISSGELTTDEARQMAAEQGDISPEFLEEQDILASDSNPADAAPEPSAPPQLSPEQAALFAPVEAKSYNSELFVPFQNDILQLLLSRNLTPYSVAESIQDLAFSYGQDAYLRGIADGGGGQVTLSDLEPDEASEMNALIAAMTARAFNVAVDALDMDATQAQARAFLWANKGLDSLYYAGKLAGASNKALEWVYGETEHCEDCQKLNGRVYRARIWKKYEIMPRSSALACKGFNCQCELMETDKPLMRGKPPTLSGLKHFIQIKQEKESAYAVLHFGVQPALIDLQNDLRAMINAEWSNPETFHITLVHGDKAIYGALIAAVEALGDYGHSNEMIVSVSGVSTFQNTGRDYPVVARIDSFPLLNNYQKALYTFVRKSLPNAQISEYCRPEKWNPHITLGYSKMNPTLVLPFDTLNFLEPLSLLPVSVALELSVGEDFSIEYAHKQHSSMRPIRLAAARGLRHLNDTHVTAHVLSIARKLRDGQALSASEVRRMRRYFKTAKAGDLLYDLYGGAAGKAWIDEYPLTH